MKTNPHYCCPEAKCDHAILVDSDQGLRCPNGHRFPYSPGTQVPVFATQRAETNEYAHDNSASIHDNALRWVFETFGTDEASLRKSLVARLHLSTGKTILVTGAGAGNDLPYLVQSLEGEGVIYAQDISEQMLLAGVERYGAKLRDGGVKIHFSVGDAMNLPFSAGFFDAAYHFGGLNLFPNIREGISEMNRVVKSGGRIVISDEGIAPWLRHSEYGRMLVNNNPLYAYEAPLDLLPESARSVKLTWELSNCFYVIEFEVSDTPPYVDMDVPHVGKRGGSIRKRYFGQLEGIDPALRDQVYSEAEKRGISRVEYLESVIKNALGK
jgi:ubiquinone/menaquinone biosynthesis C-methylase UbiE